MKYRFHAPFNQYVDDTTWLSPNDDSPSDKRIRARDEYLARLDLTPKAAAPVDPVLVEATEAQWQVFIEQGVPLRDPAAIRWYVQREFRRLLKSNNRWTSNAARLAVLAAIKASGGVLPAALANLEDEVLKWCGPIDQVRAKRVQARLGLDSKTKPTGPVKQRFDAAMIEVAKEALNDAKFMHPKRSDKTLKTTRVDILPHITAIPPSVAIHTDRSSRRHVHSVRMAVKRDWLRTVHKAGLTHILGPKTFVLHATVDARGTFLYVAVQRKRTEITFEKGWLSLDKNNNRYLKKETR